ncbi:MAG: hypothetical protein KME12_20070 [Trichocoleus desertorum ATA4-8-CV12]|nr:hypothetical protein [Trichocoleus desertorum ATA4-8-CV12]
MSFPTRAAKISPLESAKLTPIQQSPTSSCSGRHCFCFLDFEQRYQALIEQGLKDNPPLPTDLFSYLSSYHTETTIPE